jgi:hypothetical protein
MARELEFGIDEFIHLHRLCTDWNNKKLPRADEYRNRGLIKRILMAKNPDR